MRLNRKIVVAIASLSYGTGLALAQTQPAAFTDMGDVGIGVTRQSPVVNLTVGGEVWFRVRLTQPITAKESWLDLDTATPGGIVNTYAALYDRFGNRLAFDDDSGGGSGGTGSEAAAMSFGSGSGRRLTILPNGTFGGRISRGDFGAHLPADVYWIGVTVGPASFDDPNNSWDSGNNSAVTGGVSVKLTTGLKPASQWNEDFAGLDGGEMPSTALEPVGVGPLETIICSFDESRGRGRDMFKIRVCDPAAFAVTMEATKGGGGTLQSRIYLFREDGTGVVGINGTTGGTNTRLALPPTVTIPPGIYYLAVSTNCAGDNGFVGGPYNANNQILWDFGAISNQSIAPNGPAGQTPVAYWGRQQDCQAGGDINHVKLSLTGVCYVGTGVCDDIDFNNNTVFPEDQDVIDFFTVLAGGDCP